MERAMVPPQLDTIIQQFGSAPEYRKDFFSLADNIISEGVPKISVKHNEELIGSFNDIINETKKNSNDSANGNVDIYYLRTREVVLSSGILPSELELRNVGVFATVNISKGTRYGPFQGKWAGIPKDSRYAWEVSD